MNAPEWTQASGMTRAEWELELARLNYWNTLEDDPGGVMAAGGLILLKHNPPPDIDGLPPAEAEAALDRWRAQVAAWYAERQSPAPVPVS